MGYGTHAVEGQIGKRMIGLRGTRVFLLDKMLRLRKCVLPIKEKPL